MAALVAETLSPVISSRPSRSSAARFDLVEAAIEDHYTTASLSAHEREQVRQAITKDLDDRVATSQQEIERCQAVLEEIKEQERKLLHMHYEERISGELFDSEQARIRERRHDAEALIARLSVRHEDITATLDLALEILGEDLHALYSRADDQVRRLINQAIYNALFICDETITEAELAEPFAALRDLHNAIRGLPASLSPLADRRQRRRNCPENAKGAGPCRDRAPFRVGSISEHLVRMRGLEPPPGCPDTGPEPDTRAPDASAGVQIVQFAGFRGRIGRIGRSDCCQTVATDWAGWRATIQSWHQRL